MNMGWDQLDNGFKALFGLIGIIGAFLGGGKLIRINQTDSAVNKADIAAVETEQVASHSVSMELARLSAAVAEQSKRIEDLTTKVTTLESEVHRLNNGRQTALKLLKKIEYCEECHDKYGVLLETAIATLEDDLGR